MEESIDYQGVIVQLQLENEALRNYMKGFENIQQTVNAVPHFLEQMWGLAVKHKYQLLIGLMIVYWITSLGLMFYDRWEKK